MVIRRNNQPIVGGSNRRDDGEDARPGWSVWGGVFFLFQGGKLNDEKITEINTTKALDGRRLIFCHATTNQKHVGMMEGGWDMPRDSART